MPRIPQTLKGRNFTRVAAWSRGELETLLELAEEITADVLHGPRCLAWEQAENRLHSQKTLIAPVR